MPEPEEEIEMAVRSGKERKFRYDGTHGHFTATVEGPVLKIEEDFGDVMRVPLSFIKLIPRMLDG